MALSSWRINAGFLEVKVDPKDPWAIWCEACTVTKVIVNLLTGAATVEVTIEAAWGTEVVSFPRGELTRKCLPVLLDHGLSIVDASPDVEDILQVLLDSADQAPKSYFHTRLGFVRLPSGQLAYLAHNPIGIADPLKAASVYVDETLSRPSGSLAAWVSVMENEVVGHPNLELALALGVTAPLVFLLKEAKLISLLPLWALIGPSSSGKTVSLKMMGSIYCSPEEGAGIIGDFHTTQTALYAKLGECNGLPAIFDEASAVPDWDITPVVYNAPSGRSKLRCDSTGALRRVSNFATSVCISGEQSLFPQTAGTPGLFARLVEFTLPWTDSAEHAQRLERGCRQNYGTAVVPLLSYLLEHRNEVLQRFQEIVAELRVHVPDATGIEDRLLEKYAIILTAAEIIKASLGLQLDVAGMQHLLMDLHRDRRTSLDIPDRAFEGIKAWILVNKDRFPESKEFALASNIWGEHGKYHGESCIWIIGEHFMDALQKVGVTDTTATLREFHKRGWLHRFGDRYRVRHKIAGLSVNCYCIRVSLITAQNS